MESHDVELIYELSPIQQAMLFHGLYEPGSGVYVLQQSLRLTGRLNLPALERAWQHVVDRHAILRTAFFWEDLEKPVQVVYRQVRLEVARVSWRGVTAEEQRALLAQYLERDREQGFDVAAAPLMRVALFELDEDVHQLVWTQHHLVVDGWSQGQVLRELFAGYAAFASGRESRLEPAPGYRDYISWLQQQDLTPAEALWRKYLAGLASPTRIAAERGRAEAPSARQARRRDLVLPPAVATALREMARRQVVTLNTLMQGAWAVVLSRLTSGATGSAEVVFGATVAGRPPSLPGVESIVGPFLNTLPVRVAVRPERRLREWLGELQERQVEMRHFEHSPLVDVQRWSGLPAGTPLFDHILVFENVALPAEAERALPDLAIVEEEARALTNYVLDVVVVPGADSLTLSIRYDADHFTSVEIARLLDRLGQVLTAMAAAQDDAMLGELTRLSAVEQHQVIVEWGGTPGETPDATLHGRFMAQAARTPEAAAVTYEGVTLTYAGLDRRSNRLARRLRSLGVGVGADGRESLVGLCCERSPELIEGILGILKAGGAYVPLDPRYPRERLTFMMEDAGIGIVAGTRAAVEGLGGAREDEPSCHPEGELREREGSGRADLSSPQILWVAEAPRRMTSRTVLLDAHRPFLDTLSAAPVPERAGGGSLAYVIYTSGSTGRPKGVPVSHGNVVRLFDATQGWLGAGARDVWTLFHSFAFDFSVWEIWGALLHGGRLVVVPWEISRSPPQFLALLAAEGVTVLNQTPSAFAQLAAADAEKVGNGRRGNRLRLVIFGGEALDVASLAPWFDRRGEVTPRLVNMYGITETTVHVTVRPLHADDARTGGKSIGSPLPDLGLYLLDRWQQLVPIGAAGELVVGGAGLARGYLGHPELTAERFVPDGLSGRPGARLYRSGDLGRFLPTGELEFLGRIDHQVKIRGFRIELGEIEAVLAKHSGVRECAVLATRTGETARLVAYCVPGPQGEPSTQELRAWLRTYLPDHMLPAAFVWLPALPLTANGKVDRQALLALPEAASAVRTAGDGFVAPPTPAEELVANIFAEVLQLDTVGADADFFALGGHSLLATQMVSRVRQALGVDMPLRLLFEEPTVAGLAARLQSALVSGDSTMPAWTAIPRRAMSEDTAAGEPPLSFAQERLWFLDQLTPGNPIYNIPGALELEGRLDVAALTAALAEVVRRQEVLRTVFRAPGGQPVQVVLPTSPAVPVSLPVIDLGALPEAVRAVTAARLQKEEAVRGFDLAAGPLFRSCLLQLTAARHLLLLTFHHIAFDGWSIRVLAQELAACYGGSPLPELPIQYADFAAWQRAWLTGETLERFVGYWGRHLSGVPALRLPLDRPRPPLQGFVGLSQPLSLTAEMAGGVRALARRQAVTPFMVGLTVFAALLHRSSGQDDFAVGTWVANRNRPELEGLIGYFVNNLALRLDLAGPSTFDELLASVREAALGAYAHQDLPFEKLIEDLKLPRDLSLPAVFQVVCVQQPAAGRLELAGVGLELQAAAGARAHVDLSLDLGDPATFPYTGSLIYNHELFDRTTIARFGGHFERLLVAALMADPAPLAELPLLSPTESWQLRGEWSRGPIRTGVGVRFVHQLIEHHAAERPEAEAVVWPGGERLTYGELNARANRLARRLRRYGVGPETRVAIWLPRSVEAVVCVLAVLKAGGCYVPLDATYSGERLAFMAADAQARVLVTRGETAVAGGTVLRLDDPAVVEVLAAESDADLSPEKTGLAPENLAYVIYTSGSTGQPKGTMIEHGGLLNAYYAYEQAYRLGDVTAHLQMASFSFDVFTGDFIRALGSGARLVLCPREVLLDPERLYGLMVAERVDGAEFVPAVVRALVDHLERSSGDLGFMRLLVVSSDAWYAGEVAALARLCGPRTRLIDSYGVTEATIDTTFLPLATGDGTPCLPVPTAAAVVPIGRPLAGNEVWVLGGVDLLPPRMPGELCIGGSGMARGYLGRPELTAEKFTPHPFATVPGARLYRAGDLARWLPDGSVEFLGRVDSQIKVRGFRIEPGEIEAALGAHPGIKQSVVLAFESPRGKQLVAYAISHAATPDDSELRAFLKERLPDYMVPAIFVPLAELPLTANGKIDRRALPIPDWSRAAGREARQPPSTPGEEMLAAIWREVLGVAEIDARDDFFALGGHSLLATRVVARLRAAAGVELPLRSLFVHPVLAELAREVDALRRAGETAFPPVTRVPRGDTAPLSFAQERLWFLYRFAPQSNAYNIPLTLRLDGGLRLEVAARALGEIARRHEVLRSVIREGDESSGPGTRHPEGEERAGRIWEGGPSLPPDPLGRQGSPQDDFGGVVQVICPAGPVDLPLFDLSALPDERHEPEMRRLLAAETGRPFDLTHGPVLHALLVRLGERRHAAAITLHHIATDGWSTGILVRELCALYRAFALGEPSPLAELPVQYADYAVWQRRWLSGAALDELLAWWRGRLGADPPPLDLPVDRPRSRDRAWGGATTRFTLDPALAGRLNRFSRERSVSLFMTLLAGWKALLARLSGQTVITVGTPVAHRPGVEVEELIGFFLNTLVLATDVSGAPSFAGLLERVRETSLEAHAHQDAPFDRLVEDLVGERDLSVSPLFQVIFVLQNVPGATADLPDLRLTWIPAAARAANFDLALMMDEGPAGLGAQLDYSTDLFDATTVERLVHCFQTVLAAAMNAPEARTEDLPLLTPAEAHQLLREHNDTAAGAEADTLPALFEGQARRIPAAPAVFCDGRSLTFAELNARANQLAHFLRRLGVEPEVGIGLCAERSLDLAIGLLGILKAGGAYVPLDPRYPRERLALLMGDAGVQVVLGTAHALAHLPVPVDGFAISLNGPDAADAAEIASCPQSDPPAILDPDNIAYVLYTSGSTGRPKGVMVTHGSVARYTCWSAAAYRVAEHTGSCLHTPLSFDLTVTSLLTPLLAGRPVQLLPDGADLDGLAQAVAATGFGFVKLTPAHLELLRDVAPSFTAADPLTLVVGGEALHGAALRGWPERARVFNEYGPTEATVGCSVFPVEPGQREGPVPIGRPITGARLYVLDAGLHPLPLGVAGELWIGGAGLARGYLSRPDLTAERFLPDACSGEPGARLYRTGDRARRRPGGQLEFLGRLDAQVKIRGFRIEPGEVEAALAACPGVERAAVLVKDARLVGYVVGPKDTNRLLAALRERLPEHMIPAVVVPLATLPLTANGKVDRKALLAVGDPGSTPLPESRFVAPRNATETLLAEVWAQVLGRGDGRIGVHDSFFQLGGDSILSLQVVSRAARAGLRITPRQLFERPTIAELAAVAIPVIPAATPAAAPRSAGMAGTGHEPSPDAQALERLRAAASANGPVEDLYPLSPIQQGLLFHALHAPESGAYVVQMSARFSALDVAAFVRSWQQMADRHPVLRTAFAWQDLDEPVQVVHAHLPLLWEHGDWRGLTAAAQAERLAEYLRADRRRGFDLGAAPLMRLALFRLDAQDEGAYEGDYRFVWTHHHAILDGWSMPILLRELFTCYTAERQGTGAAALPPVLPYRDYIDWLRGQDLAAAEAFWRTELAGLTGPTPLPESVASSEEGAGEVRQHRRQLRLPGATSDALGAFARRHGLTLNTLAQGAWALLLARHSGEEEVVFGAVTAGRGAPLPGIESMVGLFTNILPVRTQVPAAASLLPWLQRLQERQAAARQFEHTPLSRVQAWSSVPAGTPLFESLLTFENYPLDDALRHEAGAALAIGDLEGAEQSHYPLGLIVVPMAPGTELSLRLLYEEPRFDAASGERLLGHFASLLTGMLAEPAERLTLADLLGHAGDPVKARAGSPRPPAAQKPQETSPYVAPRDRTEELLAEVWLQVLGHRHSGGRIGIHDSFFQLGGDSILSLQVVSRAARAGLRITPRQLLESQTIVRLAPLAVLASNSGSAAVRGRPAPLTPIQEWFFAAAPPHPEHYNQSLLLAPGESVAEALAPDLLRRAIGHLWAHHDALRLRFLPPAHSRHWRQVSEAPVGAPPFLHVDLSALPEADRPRALEASAGLLQASLDLTRGPILRAALFGTGSTGGIGDPGQDRLLLIIHHLAVDGVSWRILAQDLEEVYRQLERGETVELPPRTTSFLRWAERLHEHARTPAALAEAAWWLEQPLPDRPLPVDLVREGVPTVASLRGVEIRLTAEETRALLEDAPRAYRTQVNDLLLTALVEAFAPWTGSRRLLLDLEGHGREDLFENGESTAEIDLSRTVGWFTSLFPVALDLTGIETPGAALKAVKEQLRAVPNRGIGFGIVRWLADTEETAQTAARLRSLPVPEVAFNYLGQLAARPAEDRLFRLAGEPAGATAYHGQPLHHLLEINGGVTGGQLWMQLGYSADRHRRETIEHLGERFADALRCLVAHCLEPGAGGLTPSDFPLAGLDAAALDRLMLQAPGAAPIEDIYPLTPLQQGMLFHSLHSPGSGAYVVQTSIHFGAGLGAAGRAALERSWQQVVDRHPILRTAFRWLGLNEPVQVVSAPFPITWEHHDWRGLPAAEQAERVAGYLRADRERGFDFTRPPLLRLALLHLGIGEGTHRFVWTHHHAILDAWSLQILLRELFTCYAAERQGAASARLPPVRSYRDHIAWLRRQDLAAAEAFWRAELAGFTAPTPLPGATGEDVQDGEDRPPTSRHTLLSAAASDALPAFARRHQLTLNTLAQGAWALLLARSSGEDDVVFGAVTAGRGAPLAGIDSMVGLFVNTLPVRARVPHRISAVPWLLRLQESQVAARHFEHTPLPKVRAWSELPAGAPLFESILGFENYPLDEALRDDVGTTVAITGVEGAEQTHYPLNVVVQPGPRWALHLAANAPRLDAVSLARLLGHLENLLLGLIDEETAELPVAELPLLAPAERQQLLIELPADLAGLAKPAALTEQFAQRAKRSPWQIAVVCRGVPLTYAELDQRSACLAGYLRRAGVGPEVCVGLAVEPSLERVVGLLGILRAGGAAVPVDPGGDSHRMLDEVGIALLLTMQRWQSGFSWSPNVVCLDRDWPLIAAESTRAERLTDRGGEPESLAVISSASRRPGLMISHRAITTGAGPLPSGLLDDATAETLDALRNGARPRTHAFVLDRRHQPAPVGAPGELFLAGPGLPRGILDRPDLTAKQLVPHPWSSEPGERLYRTGDRARRHANGTIEILGSASHLP